MKSRNCKAQMLKTHFAKRPWNYNPVIKTVKGPPRFDTGLIKPSIEIGKCNIVSKCCHKDIVTGYRSEAPFDPNHFIDIKFDMCEGCGKEVEGYLYADEETGEIVAEVK